MGNSSDRRVLGRFVVGTSGKSCREAVDDWRRANLEQYIRQHQTQNTWARGGYYSISCSDNGYGYSGCDCELVWDPVGPQLRMDLKQQAELQQRQLQVLQLQMQQSQAEYERARQQSALAQVQTYAPLYGSKVFNGHVWTGGQDPAQATSPSQTLAQPKERYRAKAEKSSLLKFKVWAYSKLSGASPFQVYRQLKREERQT
jgi:hypothetical protein